LLITARSHNIIFALKHYSWLTDREGNYLPKPNHLYSDVIDAMRYLAYMKFTHKQQDPKENRYSIM
jgi:phage terminase large subunit